VWRYRIFVIFSVSNIYIPGNGVLIIFLDSGRNFVLGTEKVILDYRGYKLSVFPGIPPKGIFGIS